MKNFTKTPRNAVLLLAALALSGCAALTGEESSPSPELSLDNPSYQVAPSYLKKTPQSNNVEENTAPQGAEQTPAEQAPAKLTKLPGMADSQSVNLANNALDNRFTTHAQFTIAAEKMPLPDFIHYVFGSLLKLNYVVDESLKQSAKTVTLDVSDKISARRLFQLSQELLNKESVQIRYDDNLYFLSTLESGKKGNVSIAVGRNRDAVPRTVGEILQVVPLKYGIKISIQRTVKELVGVDITVDYGQNALFVRGERDQILRTLELVDLLDVPANRGRHIGLVKLTYLDSETFTKEVGMLLENEGIPASTGLSSNKNLVMVPISQLGAIAVFASNAHMLERVRFWAETIDQPGQGTQRQYFIYHPNYARANDLGESISPLISGSFTGLASSGSNPKTTTASEKTGQAPSANRTTGASSKTMTMVVDERANALIFNTTGAEYQAMLPLLKKLDVLPRQVMLDITIAEVTLSGEFKHGVEWAIKNGDLSAGTNGAFEVAKLGGFSFSLDGGSGDLIRANFFEKNSLVNVLSNPSLLVRDGVAANIAVGTKISVVGATTSDPVSGERETTSSEYRDTGVNVTVTPTINARGIVIMNINQKISNSVPDTKGASDNPDIFERTLATEVVAASGQTVIMGGLISENNASDNNKTPGIANVPVVGELFKAKGENNSRTELVMMITPKVIDRTDQWAEVTNAFRQGLNYLHIGSGK